MNSDDKRFNAYKILFGALAKQLKEKVVGQDFQIELFLSCLITKEHISFIGESGVGKTFLVESFVELLQIDPYYDLLAGHPEIMPQDFSVRYDLSERGTIKAERIRLLKTAIFFVDEFNRIPPKSLSILLSPLNNGTLYDETSQCHVFLGYNLDDRSVSLRPKSLPEQQLTKRLEKILHAYEREVKNGKIPHQLLEDLVNQHKMELTIKRSEEKTLQQKLQQLRLDGLCIQNRSECYDDQIALGINATLNTLSTEMAVLVADVKSYQREQTILLKLVEHLRKSGGKADGQWFRYAINLLLMRSKQVKSDQTENMSHQAVLPEKEEISVFGGPKEETNKPRNFFLCVLARNPTSRGGNFPPPDALLDRIGAEVHFNSLKGEDVKQIMQSERGVAWGSPDPRDTETETRKAAFGPNSWQEIRDEFLTTPFVNLTVSENEKASGAWFFQALEEVGRLIDLNGALETPGLKDWCDRLVANLKSPSQFIVDTLTSKIQKVFQKGTLGYDLKESDEYIAALVRPWALDIQGMLRREREEVSKRRLRKIIRESQLKTKLLARVHPELGKDFSVGKELIREKEILEVAICEELVDSLSSEIYYINKIDTGFSGRMAGSLYRIALCYLFIQDAQRLYHNQIEPKENTAELELPNSSNKPIPAFTEEEKCREILSEIAYHVCSHRIKFLHNCSESDKQRVITRNINRTFAKENRRPKNWFGKLNALHMSSLSKRLHVKIDRWRGKLKRSSNQSDFGSTS